MGEIVTRLLGVLRETTEDTCESVAHLVPQAKEGRSVRGDFASGVG